MAHPEPQGDWGTEKEMRVNMTEDRWDVRITLRCQSCGREETDTYSRLMHSDHFPIGSVPDPCPAYCPRCVVNGRTPVRQCGYGAWRLE
jgi:hypothetical protein